MIDFIDKTTDQNGTPLNRKNLMAIQGFEAMTTTFNSDGSITETNASGQVKTTVFNSDGSVTERFEGEKTITKKITFSSNKITEVIS